VKQQWGMKMPVIAVESARRKPLRLIALSLLLLTALFVLYPFPSHPHFGLVGYGLCHQLPSHSFFAGGAQLPFCARCSGMYLGILAGFFYFYLIGKGKAGRFPSPGVLGISVVVVIFWALDGINSYLGFWPQFATLYEPNNYFRLASGLLIGACMALILYPTFNQTFWRNFREVRVLEIREGGGLLVLLAAFGLLVSSGWGLAYYPLALALDLTALGVLAGLNMVFGLIIFRQDGLAWRGRDLVFPYFLSTVAAMAELVILSEGRFQITQALNLGF